MAWIDTLEHVNTIVAVPATLTGFGFTLWQLAKTRSAAQSASTAVRRVEETLSRNHLLILLPQLQRIEQDLEVAVGNKDVRLIIYHLGNWRWQAGQLRGFLDEDPRASKRLVRAIQQSIALTAETKLDLLEREDELLKVTRGAREAITAVTGELGGLVSLYSTSSGGSDDV
jgi:hypothetical protein